MPATESYQYRVMNFLFSCIDNDIEYVHTYANYSLICQLKKYVLSLLTRYLLYVFKCVTFQSINIIVKLCGTWTHIFGFLDCRSTN